MLWSQVAGEIRGRRGPWIQDGSISVQYYKYESIANYHEDGL
jgi:hypothetical protein